MSKFPSKVRDCEGCTVKRRLTMFEMRHYVTPTPGGTVHETWLCTSCSKVLGLHELMTTYTGQLMLTVNSKLDLMAAARTPRKRK